MFGKRRIKELTKDVEILRNLNEELLERNKTLRESNDRYFIEYTKLKSLMEFIQDEEHMAEVEIYNMDNKPVYKFKTCLINIEKKGIIVRLSDTTFADLNLSYNCCYDVKVKLYTERQNYSILNTDLEICFDDEFREIEKSRVGMLINFENLL